MSFDNLAVKWTTEEEVILEKHLDCDDLEELMELLPGRSKNSIKAKIRRVKKDLLPDSLAFHAMKYNMRGDSLPEILTRMKEAGYTFTLKNLAKSIKVQETKLRTVFKAKNGRNPSKEELIEFANG